MLQKLRSTTGGIVAKAFMILLVISFGAWGVQGYLNQASQGEVVATIGSDTITTPELADAFGRDVRRFQAQGSDLTAEQARNLGLMNVALDRLIQGRLYDAAADWLGMGISNARIATAIRQEELFQDSTGNFSRSRYESLLRNSNLTERQYTADLRRDMLKREVINSLAFTAGAPSVLEKKLHLYRNEKRIATITLVAPDETLDVGVPDEATIEQNRQDQAERYTAPERRSVSFILLNVERAMKDVTVTDEDLRAHYEENLGSYTTPEKRTVQQIPFSDEETARKAAAIIGEGRTFEAVAKDLAGVEGEALKYGEFTAGSFPIPDIAWIIDTLPEGGISEPVSTDFGWHIFRISAIQPATVLPFEEIRDQIESNLMTERAAALLYGMSAALEDEFAAGGSLESAAEAMDVEIRKSVPIDIEGAGPDGKKVDGLPDGEFINTVFLTEAGETSDVAQATDGSYYVLRVEEIIPAALRPLAEVKDEIVADWQKTKRREAAEARALAIVEKVENSGSLVEIAAAEGLTATDSKPFNRRGEGVESNLMTAVLASDVFRLQPGQAAMVETGDGFVVAQLKSVQPAGPADTKNLGSLIGNQITGDILRQFDNALRQEFSVNIDQAVLARTPLPQ